MPEDAEHKDRRAAEAPAETPPEEDAEGGEAGESHGPLGNPASDEEALRNRQQEGARGNGESGDGDG
jgi:hypothetical protein